MGRRQSISFTVLLHFLPFFLPFSTSPSFLSYFSTILLPFPTLIFFLFLTSFLFFLFSSTPPFYHTCPPQQLHKTLGFPLSRACVSVFFFFNAASPYSRPFKSGLPPFIRLVLPQIFTSLSLLTLNPSPRLIPQFSSHSFSSLNTLPFFVWHCLFCFHSRLPRLL